MSNELRRNLQINGETYHLAVNQYGPGAPTSSTPGKPGVLYMDTDTGKLYKCTAADAAADSYVWVPVDCGYYIPAVSQPEENTVHIAYVPSEEGMPAVEPVVVTLPVTNSGATGGATTSYNEETGELTISGSAVSYDDTTGELTI